MRRATLVGWLTAAALCCVTVLTAAYVSSREERATLRLADLAISHEQLMSCADGGEVPSGEALWCADPSSPQCIPAAPPAPRAELWHGQPAWLGSLDLSLPPVFAVSVPWQRPLPEREPAVRRPDRLERPPRV